MTTSLRAAAGQSRHPWVALASAMSMESGPKCLLRRRLHAQRRKARWVRLVPELQVLRGRIRSNTNNSTQCLRVECQGQRHLTCLICPGRRLSCLPVQTHTHHLLAEGILRRADHPVYNPRPHPCYRRMVRQEQGRLCQIMASIITALRTSTFKGSRAEVAEKRITASRADYRMPSQGNVMILGRGSRLLRRNPMAGNQLLPRILSTSMFTTSCELIQRKLRGTS